MNKLLKQIITYMLDQYMTVLIVMASVASLTYLILIYDLKDHEGDTALIRISAEQSQLIQEIELSLTRLVMERDNKQQQKLRAKVISQLTTLKDSHISLRRGERFIREGNRLIHVAGTLSRPMGALYFEAPFNLDDRMEAYMTSVRKFIAISGSDLSLDNPKVQKFMAFDKEKLLEGLSTAVSFHQQESEYKLSRTINMQHLMFAVTLCSLLIVGGLILRPLVFKLRDSMSQLKKEKEFTENVLDTSQALIIGLDVSGKIVLFNQYAQEITGWYEQEVVGGEFFKPFFADADQQTMHKLFVDMMENGVSEGEIENSLLIRSGEALRITWHMTVVKESGSELPALFLATGIDITERKKAELNLQKTLSELEQISTRMQDEIKLAANLQKAILPSPVIDLPGMQGQANLVTSSEVGGDYYDYFQVGGKKTVLLVGDVSGHGVAAGTMVSAAKAGIFPLVHEGLSQPSEILRSLNETMFATAHQSLLMTMACISLDASTGQLQFANAGHVLPYIRRKDDRKWIMLEAAGMPLGKSLSSEYDSSESESTLEIGDRLFMYTDGLVEEESPQGEPFGYDRLEKVLEQYGDAEPEVLHGQVMEKLRQHCGGRALEDDVTVVIVNHTDRVVQANATASEASDIIRISDNFYRQGAHPIPRISRQFVVFFANDQFADLLPRFSQDGVCRILPKSNAFCQKIGMDILLNQHHEGVDADLYCLMSKKAQHRQFQLTHTDDKSFVMEEIMAWLSEHDLSGSDYLDSLMILMDEMLENSLYAAPRDGQDKTYYQKGEVRELSANEDVRIDVSVDNETLGLMVTDNWGTLAPANFLQNLSRAMHQGIQAGMGGGGLYMMWRLSDYLQIPVHPHKRTQVTILWDLSKPFAVEADTGFQFLYHSEQEEVLS